MIRFSAISALLFGRYALATGIPRSQTLALEVLSTQVQGRLYEGEPYSKPCFEDFDSAECESLRAGNANDSTFASDSAWLSHLIFFFQRSGPSSLGRILTLIGKLVKP